MMGQLDRDQGQLFYSFSLDDAVPDDHPVREIAAVLDLSWVHAELAPYYPQLGRRGRPSCLPSSTAPRANWKGYLRLSLVSCPIALYPASSLSEKVSFNRINRKTGNPPRHAERLGIWVAIWPVSLLVLSQILEKKMQE
jgi:hypothetical protein